MRFDIPRVPFNIRPETFHRHCYEPRRPVVIEGVGRDWPATRHWSREYLERQLERSGSSAARKLFWWDIDDSLLADDLPRVEVIEALRERQRPNERARSRRLWMSNGGERTPWHYDGNSLEVFNAQIVGRKRFTLVSPETPIQAQSFSLFGKNPDAQPETLLTEDHDYTTFDLEPGDLLYLPRHWFHFVESLDPFNANINWVWTDLRSGSLETPVGKRERDLVAVLYAKAQVASSLHLPDLPTKPFDREYAREYGGRQNFEIPRSFFEQLGLRHVLRAAFREVFGDALTTSIAE